MGRTTTQTKPPARVFLSYSSADVRGNDNSRKLATDVTDFRQHLATLESAGTIAVWIDSEKITTGDRWEDELNVALSKTDVLIAVMSKNYFASAWCKKEFKIAQERGLLVIPVLLEMCAWEQSALNHLDATPDKGKKAVLDYPENEHANVWTRVVRDVAAAVKKYQETQAQAAADTLAATVPTIEAVQWTHFPGQSTGPKPPPSKELPDATLDITVQTNGSTVALSYYRAQDPGRVLLQRTVSTSSAWTPIPQVDGETGTAAVLALVHGGEQAVLKTLGKNAPAILGEALYSLLFGPMDGTHELFAAVFEDAAGSHTTAIRGPVRCRITTSDPQWANLPWRLTRYENCFLVDQGWTFELAAPGHRDAVVLESPPRVLLIVPDTEHNPAASHFEGLWRTYLGGLSETIGKNLGQYLYVAHSTDDLQRVLRHDRRLPTVVIFRGGCTTQANGPPRLLLGDHEGVQTLTCKDFADLLPPSVKVLYLELVAPCPTPHIPTEILQKVPAVLVQTTPSAPVDPTGAALAWFNRCIRDALDPTVALHRAPHDGTHTWTTATSPIWTRYHTWTTREFQHKKFIGMAEKYLNRDDQRSAANTRTYELIHQTHRRVELFVAYGDSEQHMGGLGSLISGFLKDRLHREASFKSIKRRFPDASDRCDLPHTLTTAVCSMLGGSTVASAVANTIPQEKRLDNKRPVLFLDWGVSTPEDRPTGAELETLIHWHTQTLAHGIDPTTVVVALACLERPTREHSSLKTWLDGRRSFVTEHHTRGSLTVLPPLEKVDLDHVKRFLADPKYSSCGTDRAPRAAGVIMAQSGGVFKTTCDEIDKAENIGWDVYLATHSTVAAPKAPRGGFDPEDRI